MPFARLARLPRSMLQRWEQMQRLRRVLPTADAVRVVSRSTRDRSTLIVRLTPSGRRVTLRANTSDVACLEKVFVEEEYRLPREANPAFDTSPRLVVDAGANIGMATLYFAQTFPDARIVAIEPEPSNFAALRVNCEGLPNVSLKHAALWPVRAALQLADSRAENWMFSVRPASDAGDVVPAITIPEILAESGADRIDLLKLDIEGAERELFSDACEEWLPRVRMIVIELHDRFGSGCAENFYSHLVRREFIQEIRGENIFVLLGPRR
jgi:FkbM family methyltransferase